MREFSKGWRRKIGVLTLVMAMVFAAVWVRSLDKYDVVRLNGGRDQMVFSLSGRIYWGHWGKSGRSSRWVEMQLGDKVEIAAMAKQRMQLVKQSMFIAALKELPDPRKNDLAMREWIVPYWYIVIPLTLLSAYLLLSNPPSTPKNTNDPTSIEGA